MTSLRRIVGRRRGGLPLAWFMTDTARVGDPFEAVAALPHGVGVIVRDYARADRRPFAAKLVALCRDSGRPVLIAGDAALARDLGADGVHWPDRDVASRGEYHFKIVTVAVHDHIGLRRARRQGADAVLVSPVFATASHPDAKVLGLHRFRRLASAAPCPVYALGGINLMTVKRLANTDIAGIAGIGCFLTED